MKTALLLSGHGSHISPHTAGIVWDLVDSLRARRVADEITAAFWKETPSFHSVLNTLTADDVTIIPLFTAQGYFTQTVIPAEMGLAGDITRRDGRIIRYAHTLSEHPNITSIVQQRVIDALRESGEPPERTAVAIIGHGTRRAPESHDAAYRQAELLREQGIAAEVIAVFLDDTPNIPDVYALTSAPTIIAVPLFLAPGSHTTLDVPAELGLESGQTRGTINGRTILYTPPIGTAESLQEMVLDLALEAGATLHPPTNGTLWDAFPAAGRDELIETVHDTGSLRYGELLLTPSEVRKAGDTRSAITLTDIPTLRRRVREQPFRPLATARGLPGGWRIDVHTPEMLHATVETIYPGAVADWAANRRQQLYPGTFAQTVARQTGKFRDLARLTAVQIDATVTSICGHCVRHPTWHHGETPAAQIPCAEPCNFWMSRAQEYLS